MKDIPKNLPKSSVGTLISHDTQIVGDVKVNGNIKIEGLIKGKVEVTGELVVINSGKIEGEIFAGSAIIAGEVMGNLHTQDKTVLASQSILTGDLKTKKLVIEEGAQLQGNCEMKPEPKARENTP